jgi:hypothetical protein
MRLRLRQATLLPPEPGRSSRIGGEIECRGARQLEDHCRVMLARHEDYVREHLEDMPEVRDWTWAAD